MKPKPDDYNQKLDEIALHTMESIIKGLYSNPNMLLQLQDIADKHETSLAQEVAERSYVMAAVMLQKRKEYLKFEPNENSKGA